MLFFNTPKTAAKNPSYTFICNITYKNKFVLSDTDRANLVNVANDEDKCLILEEIITRYGGRNGKLLSEYYFKTLLSPEVSPLLTRNDSNQVAIALLILSEIGLLPHYKKLIQLRALRTTDLPTKYQLSKAMTLWNQRSDSEPVIDSIDTEKVLKSNDYFESIIQYSSELIKATSCLEVVLQPLHDYLLMTDVKIKNVCQINNILKTQLVLCPELSFAIIEEAYLLRETIRSLDASDSIKENYYWRILSRYCDELSYNTIKRNVDIIDCMDRAYSKENIQEDPLPQKKSRLRYQSPKRPVKPGYIMRRVATAIIVTGLVMAL